MGSTIETPYGTVRILTETEIFEHTVARIEAAVTEGASRTIGLTGGSTPKRFYGWAAQTNVFSERALNQAVWMTSDERMVPLSDRESNFGEADRRMLMPLKVPASRKSPWLTSLDPHSAASSFNMRWNEKFGVSRAFDLCLLGMGDDGHTASIFPDSPLLGVEIPENFTCVDVPGKGWRLTITRVGLSRCREILITVAGAKKAGVLRDVLEGAADRYPVQILKDCAAFTTWLVDEDAAASLSR